MLTNNYHRFISDLWIKKGLVTMLTAEEKDTLVSRIEQLHKLIYVYETGSAYKEGYNQALLDVIKLVESIKIEPVAEWIDNTEWIGSFGMCRYTCSACGFTKNEKPFSAGNGKGSKFCEECGAKMSTEIKHK